MSTKVFQYGALPAMIDGNIRQQMKLGRNYYNKLIEEENNRRKSIYGGNTPKPPHEHENKKEIKECKECQSYWKELRDKYYNTEPLDLKPLRAEAVQNGLYWGTYLIVEESFSAAWKKTNCFQLLRFRSWKQGGYAGVQIQKVNDPTTKYKIERAYDPRIGRRKGQRHTIQIRVGSTNNKKPIWSDAIKFEMHRPIQGRVTWIKICMHYRGNKEIWNVNITCTDIPDRIDSAKTGVVALDVGWRVLKDKSIRLAFATGFDNKEYEFTMHSTWRELQTRADNIRGYRDNRLNELKSINSKFSCIKKPGNVKKYAIKQDIYVDDVVEWCKRDKHLEDYELGCRRRSVSVRKYAMITWMRELRRKYSHIIIKNSSHKEMKDHKKAVEAGMFPIQRKNAHHGSPGEIIEEACKVFDRNTGVSVIRANNTNTIECQKCGSLMYPPDDGILAVCEQCGATEDRDRVSTRNLLYLYEQNKSEKPTARKTTARFAKRHKNLSQ